MDKLLFQNKIKSIQGKAKEAAEQHELYGSYLKVLTKVSNAMSELEEFEKVYFPTGVDAPTPFFEWDRELFDGNKIIKWGSSIFITLDQYHRLITQGNHNKVGVPSSLHNVWSVVFRSFSYMPQKYIDYFLVGRKKFYDLNYVVSATMFHPLYQEQLGEILFCIPQCVNYLKNKLVQTYIHDGAAGYRGDIREKEYVRQIFNEILYRQEDKVFCVHSKSRFIQGIYRSTEEEGIIPLSDVVEQVVQYDNEGLQPSISMDGITSHNYYKWLRGEY